MVVNDCVVGRPMPARRGKTRMPPTFNVKMTLSFWPARRLTVRFSRNRAVGRIDLIVARGCRDIGHRLIAFRNDLSAGITQDPRNGALDEAAFLGQARGELGRRRPG